MATTLTLPASPQTSLAEVFLRRCEATASNPAWHWFDRRTEQWQQISWGDALKLAGRWQQALRNEKLQAGDRVAIMVSNSLEWVMCDQAALGLGLVVVPIFTNDRPDNIAYILNHADVKLLLTESRLQLMAVLEIIDELKTLQRVVSLADIRDLDAKAPQIIPVSDWLPDGDYRFTAKQVDQQTLATIVYTSGTTGRPKGVMLSHWNIISNVLNTLKLVDVFPQDMMLSFLPLSHMLERMAGYYLPVFCGSQVSFARSITQLAADMQTVRPSILISVPQAFEMIRSKVNDKMSSAGGLQRFLFHQCLDKGWQKFNYQQGQQVWSPALLLQPLLDNLVAAKIRARTGSRLRLAICGGAALPEPVSRFFVSLGIKLSQGYGLTETSPVLTVNLLQPGSDLCSVGQAIPEVTLKVTDDDELIAQGDNVMLGYWKNPEATAAVIKDGWFHTGDKARIVDNTVFITGRIKEIIVLSSGEKVPPYDMEQAIRDLPLIQQAMIIGEARPFLSAILVIDKDLRQSHHSDLSDKQLFKLLKNQIQQALHDFPGYAKVRRFILADQPWTIENGFLTPTMKLKRQRVEDFYDKQIAQLYES